MTPNNPMTEGEALAVLRELVLRVLASHTTEMEGYSYFSSNPGVPKDSYNEVADEIAAAIAAHTAASGGEAKGDRLAIRMLVAAGYVTEAKANEALCIAHGFDHGPVPPPPAAVPADALERLVEEMRRESTDDHPMQHRGIPTVHADIRRWADELAALIPKGADHA